MLTAMTLLATRRGRMRQVTTLCGRALRMSLRVARRRRLATRDVWRRQLERALRELRPRLRAQLAERLAQVVLDGARADEQLSGDLPIGVSVRRKARDLRLLGRELVERVHGPLAGPLTGGQQLAFGATRERLHPHAGE